MRASPTPIHEALNRWARPRGFVRRTANWRRTNDDTIQVVNLQKSDYGPQYYLNFGVWLRPIDPTNQFPQSHRCQLSARIDTFQTASPATIKDLLDLEVDMLAAERIEWLSVLLETGFDEALLDATSSIERLSTRPAAARKLRVTVDGRRILGLDPARGW